MFQTVRMTQIGDSQTIQHAGEDTGRDIVLNSEFEAKSQPLYDEIEDLNSEIDQLMLRLQLIKKIKANKISVPSLAGIEDDAVDYTSSNLTVSDIEKLFSKSNAPSEVALSKNFIERAKISLPGDSQVLSSFLVATPNFLAQDGEAVTRAVITLFSNGNIGVYSVNNGNLLNTIDLKSVIKDADFPEISNLGTEYADITATLSNDMTFSILTSSGDIY